MHDTLDLYVFPQNMLLNYNILIISKNNNISKISGKYKTIFQINVHKNV